MTDDQWDRVLDITLNSTFRSTRAALRYFKSVPHGGVLVNNASVLGWRAQHSQAHYAAAKAGVMALTRVQRHRSSGVRSPYQRGLAFHCASRRSWRRSPVRNCSTSWLPVRPTGRAAEVWEIATVIAMLASDYSTYMTGEIVSVSSQRA